MTTIKQPRRMARQASHTGTDTDNVGAPATLAPTARRPTKQDLVLALLQDEGGVPLCIITEATGWLPHTARAMLTGLRKKGHEVIRSKVEGETRYSIAEVAVQ